MKVFSFLFVLCCLLATTSIQAQTKSCSKADVAKCAKAAGISVEECAKKCPYLSAIARNELQLVDAKPTVLTAEQKTKVASASLDKGDLRLQNYKCAASKASCSKSKAKASKVATLSSSTKKKAVRA